MSYQVEFAKPAAKQFKALPDQEKRKLQPKIDALATNPRPSGVIKLKGEDNLYRIRAGDYRIVYTIEDEKLFILVVKVGHRRDIYN